MSGAVKTVVGIVASIAIPFVAPAIASSIGLSAAIGSTAGSALVGAGLGAINARATGGDAGRGALMGAIGGGISGYSYTPAAPAAPAGLPPVYDASPAGLTLVSPATAPPPLPPVYDAVGGQLVPAAGYGSPPISAASVPGTDLTAVRSGLDVSGLPTVGDEAIAAADAAAAAPAASVVGAPAAPVAGAPAAAAPAAAAAAAAPAVAPTTFSGAVRESLTNPRNWADFTLRAAGMLAGSAIAGDGLSDEERTLLRAQTDELRTLQQTNRELFNQRLEQAQNLIGESKYFDPEYFGLQRARRTQVAGAKAKAAGLRGLTGERRESEERRFDLATARDTGTAYDQGYATGQAGRLQTMQAGLSAMPSSFPSSMGEYSNLRSAYGYASDRARRAQADIGELFGSFTGGTRSMYGGYPYYRSPYQG